MNRMRILVLGVAAIAAIGLAIVMRGIMGGGSSEPAQTVAAPPPRPMARVLVAARELTPGVRLAAADMRWQEWPMEGLNAAFITDGAAAARPIPVATTPTVAGPNAPPSPIGPRARNAGGPDAEAAQAAANRASAAQRFMMTLSGHPGGAMGALEGMVVRETILQGEPLVERKLVRGGDSGFMAVVLQPGMRAMAIPVSVETAAGGFILPGDHVDVLMSRQDQGATGSGGAFRVATILRNIRVLAVDQTVTPEADAQTVVGATATLEVGPREAEVLAVAKAAGQLALVLRSYADLDGPSGVGSFGGAALGGDSGPAQRTPIRVWRRGAPTEVAQR